MLFRKLLLAVLLMGSVTIAGCSGEGGTGDVADSGEPGAAAPAETASEGTTPAADPAGTTPAADEEETPKRPKRTDLAGRWIFVLTDVVNEYPGLLLDVTPGGGEGEQVKLLGNSPMMENFTLSSGSVDGKSVSLVLQPPQNANGPAAQEIVFEGHLDDGVVLGEAQSGAGICIPAYLEATSKESLADYREPRQAAGLREMREMRQTADIIEQLRALADENARSPFIFLIYQQVLGMMPDQDVDAETATTIVEEYLSRAEQWGPCLTRRALIQSASALARGRYPSELSLPYVERAEQAIEGDEGASEGEKRQLRLARGLALAGSESDEDYQQAREILTEFAEQAPFDTTILEGLAFAAESHGDNETALRYYAELAVLPGMRGNRGPVQRLWEEQGNDPAELENYLTDVYQDTVLEFADEKDTSVPAPGQRTTLIELFTGGSCPPCVAADIATGGLEVTYPTSRLVVLRYHQNIPAADPLTNADSEARFAYYNGEGTPTLAINGTVLPTGSIPMYGPVINAPDAYAAMRGIVERELEQTTNVGISLNASVVDGNQIRFDAQVNGLDEFPETARLRFVLAEEQVVYPTPNGIRVHDMLVRAMPGGVAGIAPSEGELKYSDAILLEDLRESLQQGVTQLEERMGRQFPEQPLALDHLHLIAFLQDDATRTILQVTGTSLSTDDAGKDEESAAEKKPASDAPKPDEAAADKPAEGDKPETEKPAEGDKPAATDEPAESEKPADDADPAVKEVEPEGDAPVESESAPAEGDAAETPSTEETSGDES
ncbi:hypothetical protein Mal4_15910 [Maioricimonas rarisocia]|uniref:Thioredoxin domain-containing protein n=1 Tax=Maioricimonas rarisocia TaxID=2528026 RepID=A0A517Z482_9PLAN|nr:hypothetical protein [Maioricimonas rarisocia]QDU37281.1 hypothetical protein Mal4_15910 [Maioricimonas rarisocia]